VSLRRAWSILAAERESMGMSVLELSEKTGEFPALIRARERGEGNDSIACIIRHCHALKFSPVRFMEIALSDNDVD